MYTSTVTAFSTIGLDEIHDAALMQRFESKFIVRPERLDALLHALQADYARLETGAGAWNHYESVYLDTRDLVMYHEHRRGKLPRCKVRTRTYLDSGTSFLEIKRKTRSRRTEKSRCPLCSDTLAMHVGGPYALANLVAALQVTYQRLTLVHRRENLRLTVDRELCFADPAGVGCCTLEGLYILEIKHPDAHRLPDGLGQVLRQLGIHRTSVSKYCLGMACLGKGELIHRHATLIRQIRRQTGDGLFINHRGE